MEKEMNKRSSKIIFIVVSCLLIILPIIIYIYHFRNNPISNNPSEWNSFGNYVSGILNPILSIFTTLLLIYITILLNKKNSKETLDIRLLEDKQKAYYDILKQLSLYEEWECSKSKYNIDLILIQNKFNNFGHSQKEKIQFDHNKELMELQAKLICNNFILLKKLNFYIHNLPNQYYNIFPEIFEEQEYTSLKNSFNAFLINLEKFNFREYISLDNFNDSEIKDKINFFLNKIEVNK